MSEISCPRPSARAAPRPGARPARRRTRSRRAPAVWAVAALICSAVHGWTNGAPAAAAADGAEARLEFVSQSGWQGSSPGVLNVRIVGADDSPVSLRVRVHEPVETRAELAAAVYGRPVTALIGARAVNVTSAADGSMSIAVPDDLTEMILRHADSVGTSAGPLPLQVDMHDGDGVLLHTLRTFLAAPPGTRSGTAADSALPVAVVFDLRLPLAHTPGGGARFGPDELEAAAALAQIVSERRDMPVTIAMSPETLDALALLGYDLTAERFRDALEGNQMLLSEWTSLDVNALVAAGRSHIVEEGLTRGAQALAFEEIAASSVMLLDAPASPQAVTVLTGAAPRAAGFLVRTPATAFDVVDPKPSAALLDTRGEPHPTAVSDPFIESLLSQRGTEASPELAVHHAVAELNRLAAVGEPGPAAAVVFADVLASGAALRLLDEIAASPALSPVTVEEVLVDASRPPSAALRPGPAASDGLLEYLAQRSLVERRLTGYESLIGANATRTPPLRTLLSASAARSLSSDDRAEFLAAIDRQISEGTSGIEMVSASRITITEQTADLPITVVNGQTTRVTVALEFRSETGELTFPDGMRRIVELDPGANHLAVPIAAESPGESAVLVTLAAPDAVSAMVLGTGRREVRFADLSGGGAFAAAGAVLVLALWWAKARVAAVTARRPPTLILSERPAPAAGGAAKTKARKS